MQGMNKEKTGLQHFAKKRSFFNFLLTLFFIQGFFAQNKELSVQPIMWKVKPQNVLDTTSVLHAFKTGTTAGHLRYFFSQTTNEGILSDYFANALGTSFSYETNDFHGFKIALGAFYAMNIYSSDLKLHDPTTGLSNRYELGLFDVENPSKKFNIYRMEECNLSYRFKKSNLIKIGRQKINTPLINPQDGRLNATLIEGLWMDQKIANNFRFTGGVITKISPRGTTKWYENAQAIGLYGQGVDMNGKPAHFNGNLNKSIVGVASVTYTATKGFDFQAWDYHVQHLLNTMFIQTNYIFPSKNFLITNSAQFLRQWSLTQKNETDVNLLYTQYGAKSMSFGFKSKIAFKNWHYSLNYNRITAEGRYLFPREWGRDPFFTFMPRERNEGFGDVHAFVCRIENQQKGLIFQKSSLAIGYFNLPDVKNFTLNKYGLPSYFQLNIDTRINLDTWLKGLEGQLLIVAKCGIGETYNNPKFELNKVNMLLTNIVLNYHF